MTTDQLDPVTTELLAWISGGVHRLCASTEGLTDAQARAVVMPSGWTMLGLLGHVRDSTCFWLENIIAGVPEENFDEDLGWPNDPPATLAQVRQQVLADVDRACTAVASARSTDAPGWWPEGAFGGYRQDTVRGVLIHLLNDNAAHTGQLDIARESLDGGVWSFEAGAVAVPASPAARTQQPDHRRDHR